DAVGTRRWQAPGWRRGAGQAQAQAQAVPIAGRMVRERAEAWGIPSSERNAAGAGRRGAPLCTPSIRAWRRAVQLIHGAWTMMWRDGLEPERRTAVSTGNEVDER